jgi:uncharacterized membrane-anchored protein
MSRISSVLVSMAPSASRAARFVCGASIGDYLSQSRDDGGLGLGTTATSGLFLLTIRAVVAYLSRTGRDADVATVSETA